jgi:transposase
MGNPSERAAAEHVSESTVRRLDARVLKNGDYRYKEPARKGPHRRLTEEEASLIFVLKSLRRTVSLNEVQATLKTAYGKDVSLATISNEYVRLGLSNKAVQRYSMTRDEEDRIAYFCNSPDYVERPGVCGVPSERFVDIDETGRYTSAATRKRGHWLKGFPARQDGRSKRGDKKITVIAAVDINVGVVKALQFVGGGTTGDKFLAFITLVLLPAIQGTGSRVILMDNLTSHNKPAIDAIQAAGHKVVLRPVHSPEFGPVEWVFGYVDKFLAAHDSSIYNANFSNALAAAFDSVTPQHVKGYFSCAHFAVAGLPFVPYMGQQ